MTTPVDSSAARRGTLIGGVAILLWGALATLTVLSGDIPPFQLLAMAFGLGTLVGVAGGGWRAARQGWRAAGGGWPALALGVYGLFGYHFAYFMALRLAPPVEANLINYLWPLLIVLFAGLLPGERLGGRQLAGAAAGFAGAALLVARGGGLRFEAEYGLGYGAALACAVIWATYSVGSRWIGRRPSPNPSQGEGDVPSPLGRGLGRGSGVSEAPSPNPSRGEGDVPSPLGRGLGRGSGVSEAPSPGPSRGEGDVPSPLGRELGRGSGVSEAPSPGPSRGEGDVPSPLGRGSENATGAVMVNCAATTGLALLCHLLLEDTVWPVGGQWAAVVAMGLGPVGAAFYVWDYGVKRGDIQLLGTLAYGAPLLSTGLLIAVGLAEPSWAVAAACALIVGGALLASGVSYASLLPGRRNGLKQGDRPGA